jgi:hypothetical protein
MAWGKPGVGGVLCWSHLLHLLQLQQHIRGISGRMALGRGMGSIYFVSVMEQLSFLVCFFSSPPIPLRQTPDIILSPHHYLFQYRLSTWLSTGDNPLPLGTCGRVWKCFLLSCLGERALAFSGWKLGLLQGTCRAQGRPPSGSELAGQQARLAPKQWPLKTSKPQCSLTFSNAHIARTLALMTQLQMESHLRGCPRVIPRVERSGPVF